LLIRRALPLRSLRLGLAGQSDVVEFHQSEALHTIALPRRTGRWQPIPVEYKRSRDKAGSIAYRLQLCAQAMCLEEMLSTAIAEGLIFDVSTRRRSPVPFTAELRAQVERYALEMHALYRTGVTPAAVRIPACAKCSLAAVCLPGPDGAAQRAPGSVGEYLDRAVKESEA
jgi:CRISPR-associated exonuclease Cas4